MTGSPIGPRAKWASAPAVGLRCDSEGGRAVEKVLGEKGFSLTGKSRKLVEMCVSRPDCDEELAVERMELSGSVVHRGGRLARDRFEEVGMCEVLDDRWYESTDSRGAPEKGASERTESSGCRQVGEQSEYAREA